MAFHLKDEELGKCFLGKVGGDRQHSRDARFPSCCLGLALLAALRALILSFGPSPTTQQARAQAGLERAGADNLATIWFGGLQSGSRQRVLQSGLRLAFPSSPPQLRSARNAKPRFGIRSLGLFGGLSAKADINSAKIRVRPSEELPWEVEKGALRPVLETGTVERRADAAALSPAEFAAQYESGAGRPVVLRGLTDDWAARRWSLDELAKCFNDRLFIVGEDDDGYAVELPMRTISKYARSTQDRNPLYLFDDCCFDEQDLGLCQGFKVPSLFSEDLFQYLPGAEEERIPYRWLLGGPARSGTAPHIDPLATSAWNAVLTGRKWWVMLPPDLPPEVQDLCSPSDPPDTYGWFHTTLPLVLDRMGNKCLQFVQEPGEIVFVPGGWTHAVLNLEPSLAITFNFVSTANAARALRALQEEGLDMAEKWMQNLEHHVPHVAALLQNTSL